MADGKVECMLGQLDIFSPPVLQTCMASGDWQIFKPVQSISGDGPLTFQIPGQGSSYIDMSKTLLYVRFRVVKSDGTLYDNTTDYTVVNNTLNSLFSEVRMELNQTAVSTSNGMNHFRSYIENLFCYNETAKSTHLTSALFYHDEAGKFNDLGSSGNMKRKAFVKESKEVEVFGRLHCDMLSCDKLLLNEVDMRLTLTRNPAALVVIAAAGTNPKIEILDATLMIRKVLPNPGILVAHSKVLAENTAKYPYKRVEMLNFTLADGIFQKSIESLFLNRLPSRIIFGLIKNSAFSGGIAENCLMFEHFNLNYVALSVNSAIVGSTPYRPNYAEGRSIMPYLLNFYHAGIGSGDDGYCVSRQDFAEGYNLYCFDLTPDLGSSESHWSLQQQGNCRLELAFAQALPCVVNLIVYAETGDCCEIDRNREIHVQYKT